MENFKVVAKIITSDTSYFVGEIVSIYKNKEDRSLVFFSTPENYRLYGLSYDCVTLKTLEKAINAPIPSNYSIYTSDGYKYNPFQQGITLGKLRKVYPIKTEVRKIFDEIVKCSDELKDCLDVKNLVEKILGEEKYKQTYPEDYPYYV